MTEEELKAIEARANAATEGPWVNMPDGPFWGEIKQAALDGNSGFITIAEMAEADDRTEDFEFIAHARTDVPALIAEVRRLREALEGFKDTKLDERGAEWFFRPCPRCKKSIFTRLGHQVGEHFRDINNAGMPVLCR